MQYGRSGPKKHFHLHRDNAPAIINLDLLGFYHVYHSQYSPDLAPMDFNVFQTVKAELRGKKIENTEEYVYATWTIVNKLADRWYRDVFNEWIKRHILCM